LTKLPRDSDERQTYIGEGGREFGMEGGENCDEERSDEQKVVSYVGRRYVRGAKRQAEGSSLEERRYIDLAAALL